MTSWWPALMTVCDIRRVRANAFTLVNDLFRYTRRGKVRTWFQPVSGAASG